MNTLIMKMIKKITIAIVCLCGCIGSAEAQYYQIANQLGDLLSPALSGSFKYKGYADVSYLKGVGGDGKYADFLGVSTTQGFQYASWFFMGVGAGVDIVFSGQNDSVGILFPESTSESGVMIPLFTDFRFNIGDTAKTSMFIDLRLGASFLVSGDDLRVGNGYLTRNECFYFRPSLGIRIPVNNDKPKQALNISASYQLLGSEWSYYDSLTLHSVGATVAFEW